MQFGIGCMECLLSRYANIARAKGDWSTGVKFMKEIMGAMASAPEGVAAPWLTPVFAEITEKYYGQDGLNYEQIKQTSNEVMAALLPELQDMVRRARDPLRTALSLAQVGNYIDFTALYGKVSFDELRTLLKQAETQLPDAAEYERLCSDLSSGKKLVYICDNAGEVFTDRIAAEEIKKRFPQLETVFAVRGKPAVNDALREDAIAAGLDRLGRIIDNGSGISGTELAYLGGEMAEELHTADVIIAKGQGNFETMLGCGRNVYYLFLCKCQRFTEFFHVPLLTAMLVNEQRLSTKYFHD